MRTPICDLLGVKYPIIQGGMAWIATAELAAAVSEAGGLGIIGAGSMPAELVREEIRKAKTLTSKPFGVNVYYMSPHVEEVMQVILQEGVAVVTTGAGNPGKHIPALKEAGIKVIPVIASVALAKRLERLKVDAIIAEGMECGGHTGEITTMALVPQVVDAVNVPVIAAGGVADGRGLVAALALGAQGVQMGTRFICAAECTVHPDYKQVVIGAGDRDTVITGESIGHRVRILKNKFAKEFLKLEQQRALPAELAEVGTGRLRIAARDGDMVNGSLMAGQIAAMVNRIQPAQEIINELITEADTIIAGLNKFGGK